MTPLDASREPCCRECNTPLEREALLCDECVERFTAMMERERDRVNGRET